MFRALLLYHGKYSFWNKKNAWFKLGFLFKRVLVREAMSEIITSKENPAVKHAARLLKSAKFRRQEEAFLAEGVRLCGMRLTAA